MNCSALKDRTPRLLVGCLLAALLGACSGVAPVFAQQPPTPTLPLTGSEIVTCLQGGAPKSCTSGEIGSVNSNSNTITAGTGLSGGGAVSSNPTLSLAPTAANTVLANATAGSAVPTAKTLPSCGGSSNALSYTSGTGFGCNTISGSGSPGGTSGQIQYNNAGAFGGVTALPASNFPALTGDVTTPGASYATTLATVNSNVGSFGNSTTVPTFTVNAKGLITAAGSAAIPTASASTLGLARVDGTTLTASGGVFSVVSGGGSGCPLTGCTFTGAVYGPTAAVGSNTTQLATAAFVQANVPCVSILAYGGDNSGATDNTTARNNALAASSSENPCVYYPRGKYLFNSAAAWTFPDTTASITEYGDGPELTQLVFPSTTGIKYTAPTSGYPNNTANIHDLTVATGGTGASNGILFTNNGNGLNTNLSRIYNVTLRGSDALLGSDYWASAIDLIGWSQVAINNTQIYGTGTTPHGIGVLTGPRTSGGTATITEIVINLQGVSAYGVTEAFDYGNGVQGVSISGPNCNFTGVNYGIHVLSGGTALDQLMVNNCQIAANNVGILGGSAVTNSVISNNYFLMGAAGGSTPSTAVDWALASSLTLIGNTLNVASTVPPTGGFNDIGGYSGSQGCLITGNHFYLLSAYAVQLIGSSHNCTVTGNQYSSVGVTVSNLGSNTVLEWTGNVPLANQGLRAPFVGTGASLVSGLSAADPTPAVGDMLVVGDATSCSAGGTPTGGGSTNCLVVYLNGTWRETN